MDREEIVLQVISILNEFNVSGLAGSPVEITPTTIPIGGIAGFDSLLGLVATTHIAAVFDIPDDKNIDNLFCCTNKNNGNVTYYSVEEIADKIMTLKKD